MCAYIENERCSKFDKDKICAMPFANKLWILASLKHRSFIRWGPTGDSILLHLSDLDAYLRSLQSMFNAKDCNEFLLNLRDHGFKLVRQDVVSLIEFHHKFFARDRLEYLCMIVNESPNCEPDKKTRERKKFDAGFRMARDICLMKHGYWTQLQFYQAKTKTAMEYNAAQYALKTALEKRTSLGIPIPSKIFKRPGESILDISRDENFFGYHGEVTQEALENFFGDHKPILQPLRDATREYELLPPNVFNMDFLNPTVMESEPSNVYVRQPSPNIVKHEEELLPNDFEMGSTHTDMIDHKPNNQSFDEIFEDDDDDIEPIEETEQMEQKENDHLDLLDMNWPNLGDFDETEFDSQLFDSLPDLNSFFEEECLQNQTGVPLTSQSRFFNDR